MRQAVVACPNHSNSWRWNGPTMTPSRCGRCRPAPAVHDGVGHACCRHRCCRHCASAPSAARPTRCCVATDGSCLRNPGGATGWAYVRSDGAWAYAGRPAGTNQIGELLAVVLALADHPDAALEIQCDSSYAIGCATTWKKGWQRNNYINSQKKIVSNLEIIRQLHELLDARTAPVTFTKVKGHDLSNRWPLNTAVDVVCGLAAEATQASGDDVRATGVMEINWEPEGFAEPARGLRRGWRTTGPVCGLADG